MGKYRKINVVVSLFSVEANRVKIFPRRSEQIDKLILWLLLRVDLRID